MIVDVSLWPQRQQLSSSQNRHVATIEADSFNLRPCSGPAGVNEAAEVSRALTNASGQAMLLALEPVLHASTTPANVMNHRRTMQDTFMGCPALYFILPSSNCFF